MHKTLTLCTSTLALAILLAGTQAWAQPTTGGETPPTDTPAEGEGEKVKVKVKVGDGKKADEEEEKKEGEGEGEGEKVEVKTGDPAGDGEKVEVKTAQPGDGGAQVAGEGDAKDEEGDGTKLPDEAFTPVPEIRPEVLEDITPRQTYPYVEHHGMFRFRADLFHNLDLNTTGTSPILPPPESYLPEGNPADPDAEIYAGANIRFNYEPTLHIYEDLQIHLEMDLPDNLVLGSYPDGARIGNGPLRPDIPKIAFTGGQTPPGGRYGFRLKQAYGQVKTFAGVLRVGRMSSHWGLGMLANGGQCIDCDFGDFADRAMFITRVAGVYVILGWDFPNEGPIGFNPSDPFGQPRDQSQLDDVNQYLLALTYAPISPEEKEKQTRALKEERRPVLNGGIYAVYRTQEASFEDYRVDDTPNANDLPELEARSAQAIIPDVWLKLLWEPKYQTQLRLELEATYIYGEIGYVSLPADPEVSDCFNANATAAGCEERQRDVRQLGVAFESELKLNSYFRFGLNAGYASGRPNYGFQINDGKVDAETPPSNFKFDRDYIVDMILFREIIGAVTNATYFKPWGQFDFLTRGQDSFGVRLDVIYSFANDAGATPSGESPLGLESDLMLFYQEEGKFRADIGYGILLPLSAFKEVEGRERLNYPNFDDPAFGPSDNREPEIAQTVQARLFWFF